MIQCENCVPCDACKGRGFRVYSDGDEYCTDCSGTGVDVACDNCTTELDESEECPHGVLYCEPCTACFPPRWDN